MPHACPLECKFGDLHNERIHKLAQQLKDMTIDVTVELLMANGFEATAEAFTVPMSATMVAECGPYPEAAPY